MICYVPLILGAKYDIRVEDLQPDYGIQFKCFFCGHVAIMPATFFTNKYPDYTQLVKIEDKFKCGKCGNKIKNHWQIVRQVKQDTPDEGALTAPISEGKKTGSRS